MPNRFLLVLHYYTIIITPTYPGFCSTTVSDKEYLSIPSWDSSPSHLATPSINFGDEQFAKSPAEAQTQTA